MFDCKNLLHPFQNDPGTSQRQRIVDALLSDAAMIDGRSLADLLNYLSELSSSVNYYDKSLNISDWRPFFASSLPFLLSAIAKYDGADTRSKFARYTSLFQQKPSAEALQLVSSFIYQEGFAKINSWRQTLQGSGLPLEAFLDDLIRRDIAPLLKEFIVLTHAAAKWYCIRRPDFTSFLDTDESNAWNLTIASLYSVGQGFNNPALTKCDNLKALFEKMREVFPAVLEGITTLAPQAETSLRENLTREGEAFSQNHEPHLALIFAFLSLFRKLQGELNKKKLEHLRYFYMKVLKIQPAPPVPDKAHIVFELQKLLTDTYESFRVEKGTALNAGRDANNTDIIFETDDEIIVNEAQIHELKTFYIDHDYTDDGAFVRGVYMAPKSALADGVEKEFTSDPKSFYTLGNSISKYTDPGKKTPRPYPYARLGFALSSPVLFLEQGRRNVTITLGCRLDTKCVDANLPDMLPASAMFKKVRRLIRKGFYVIDEDQISLALSKGIPQNVIDQLRDFLPDLPVQGCYPKPALKASSTVITAARWRTSFFNALPDENIKKSIADIFRERKILSIHLSGADEWISPKRVKLNMSALDPTDNSFTLKFKLTLTEDQPAITLYNKEVLGEDLSTQQPVAKVVLDDAIKLQRGFNVKKSSCCLKKETSNAKKGISFYHFFRDVVLLKNANNQNTRIDVRVCGLKKFIVQNDENVMDVNGPVYPFGTRPDVSDFDIINPSGPSGAAAGPNFFIGSKEIFCKKWKRLQVNINWKNKPLSFNDYYKGYIGREDPPGSGIIKFGLDEENFEYKLSFLSSGRWIDEPANRKVFDTHLVPLPTPAPSFVCLHNSSYEYAILIDNSVIPLSEQTFSLDATTFSRLDTQSRNGFIKLNLRKQDFGHKNYAFVLARQMMAYSKLPKETIASAVYYNSAGDPIVIDFETIYQNISDAHDISLTAQSNASTLSSLITSDGIGWSWTPNAADSRQVRDIVRGPNLPLFPTGFAGLTNLTSAIHTKLHGVKDQIDTDELKKFAAIIPNEPWTPVISNIALDYTATAEIQDIEITHLYPFAGTNRKEDSGLEPSLFPTFCDEGTLFIGIEKLKPGSNLNILFQLAEATADSEAGKEKMHWQYLGSNNWKDLRPGFEVISDETNDLTTSGVIQFSLPANITDDNSVMPRKLFWIKASLAKNSNGVSETIGIHTQAVSATFRMNSGNDLLRQGTAMEAGKIEKLVSPDPAIKTVAQPYESSGGSVPEAEGSFYLRVSERLRHKDRAIQKWDYERLVLEAFPMVYKAKCINHSMQTDARFFSNDIPYAPGYVILAVIPDMKILKAGNSIAPKVPVSLLEKIDAFIRSRTSPFVRFRTVNPRYEKVNFCITLRLKKGADPDYYSDKLRKDLIELLAPWSIGKYDKVSFGQCVYRSDVLRFIEQTSYTDFLLDLQMSHESEQLSADKVKICPTTPRSVLIAGNIDVKIDPDTCDAWCGDTRRRCDETSLVMEHWKK